MAARFRPHRFPADALYQREFLPYYVATGAVGWAASIYAIWRWDYTTEEESFVGLRRATVDAIIKQHKVLHSKYSNTNKDWRIQESHIEKHGRENRTVSMGDHKDYKWAIGTIFWHQVEEERWAQGKGLSIKSPPAADAITP